MTRASKSAAPAIETSPEPGHDAWFRDEVQKTIDDLAAGTAKLIPEAEHDQRWREKRASLLARHGKSE